VFLLPISSGFHFTSKGRNVLFVLLGIAVLVLKPMYSGPYDKIVYAYAGNVSVSFAVYFLFTNLELPQKYKGALAAICAFLVVELFEAFDGFGVMSNTYDPIDYLANGIGITLAFLIDATLTGRQARRAKSRAPYPKAG
jgi:hypothetical protein